jgi:twinkle protein
MGISTVRRDASGAWVDDPDKGDTICFPFVEGGEIVNEKYRSRGKRFAQRTGGTKTFWNVDVLEDPALLSGERALVIVEGEMDALAVIEAGYPWVVSVPDGAPPALKDGDDAGERFEDIDPARDRKFSYVFHCWERLARVKRIIVAVDNDAPGKRLEEELVRRLDRVRCLFVTLPEGCKDLNDVLIARDGEAVLDVIAGAKPYPVSGVYSLDDLPAEPEIEPRSTGWGRLDENLKVYHPALMVVSGFANGGKSTWVMQLVSQLAKLHGWHVAVASFEMRSSVLVRSIKGAFLRKRIRDWTREDDRRGEQFVREMFTFVAPSLGESDDNSSMDWLMERMKVAVIRHGARVIVIDPWNEIEHDRAQGESATDYTGKALRRLKRFAHQFGCLVIVVAHPSKGAAMNKEADDLTLYDIADSAHWANKPDIGVIVSRLGKGAGDSVSAIQIRKIRYQPECGTLGSVEVVYDPETRTFGE